MRIWPASLVFEGKKFAFEFSSFVSSFLEFYWKGAKTLHNIVSGTYCQQQRNFIKNSYSTRHFLFFWFCVMRRVFACSGISMKSSFYLCLFISFCLIKSIIIKRNKRLARNEAFKLMANLLLCIATCDLNRPLHTKSPILSL